MNASSSLKAGESMKVLEDKRPVKDWVTEVAVNVTGPLARQSARKNSRLKAVNICPC